MAYCTIKPISNAALRKLWLDPAQTRARIEAQAGCCYDTVAKRAKRLGLPSRNAVRIRVAFDRGPLFQAMWRAGVSAHEIGRHFGVSQSAISRAADADDTLPQRKAGDQPRMTLDVFLQTLLAAQMAEQRRVEVAHAAGRPVQAVAVDLEKLFPVATDPLDVRGQAWRALWAAGYTAADAARLRRRCYHAAWRWARRHGLTWAQPGAQAVAS